MRGLPQHYKSYEYGFTNGFPADYRDMSNAIVLFLMKNDEELLGNDYYIDFCSIDDAVPAYGKEHDYFLKGDFINLWFCDNDSFKSVKAMNPDWILNSSSTCTIQVSVGDLDSFASEESHKSLFKEVVTFLTTNGINSGIEINQHNAYSGINK